MSFRAFARNITAALYFWNEAACGPHSGAAPFQYVSLRVAILRLYFLRLLRGAFFPCIRKTFPVLFCPRPIGFFPFSAGIYVSQLRTHSAGFAISFVLFVLFTHHFFAVSSGHRWVGAAVSRIYLACCDDHQAGLSSSPGTGSIFGENLPILGSSVAYSLAIFIFCLLSYPCAARRGMYLHALSSSLSLRFFGLEF